MIITKLRIKNFGKVSDLKVEFGEKLNVVYGANEAGKTTILAFIKAMLYGMTSRKRDIRENDRLRFQPWNRDFGEGELYFRDEKEREFCIKRKLGNDRTINVSDVLTARRIPSYERTSPGEVMLGLGEAAFTRTIYVPQLGCTVSPDRDDEIMARLMNLQQTGEEQVSLQKALTSLDKERKKITIRSGNGKLDSLRNLLFNFRNEREKVQKLHDENIADQSELNNLQGRKADLQKKTAELEEKRIILKKHKQYLEYEELRKYQEELNSLQKELEQIDEYLLCGDSLVNSQFLQEVQTNLIDWQNKDKQAKELEKELKEKSLELEKIEGVLGGFPGFEGLAADNTGGQVLLKEKNKETLTEKLSLFEKQRKEKEELERQLVVKKSGLGLLTAFYELTPAEEEEIAKKEELKRKLEDEQNKDAQVDTLRRDIISDKLKSAQIFIVSGLVAIVAGIISGLVFHPVSYVVSLFGAIAGFYGFSQAKKLRAALAEIENRLSTAGQSDTLKKELEKVSADLSAIYQRYGASDSQQFAAMKRRFELVNNEITIIEAKIRDRTDQYSQEEEEELRRQLQECDDYLKNILTLSACNSLNDFNEKLKKFSEHINSKENIRREIENLKNRADKLFSMMRDIEKAICEKLYLEFVGGEAIGKAETLIKEFEVKINKKKELTIRIETNKKNYQERLAGRILADIAAAAEEYQALDVNEQDMEDEEGLEFKLKELNEERLDIAKKITGLESGISSRFKDLRDIATIEEELELVTQQIKRYEEILDALDLTKTMLTSSFEELQNSFGPILNNNVGSILKKITRGKYSDVGVAENYSITIKDDTQWDRELEFFSNGTLDQVYFALRLGIIGLAYDNDIKLPLILDDTFVQYDDERLASVLEYLSEYAEQHQVLLFTCHKREAEILQGKEFNYINI
ncbi:MAG: hypothetical protein VR72_21220 [Clostridiaceae bacterium BRH_c20a]|nr:MAG: hypothetical protein VR72_21220 [Clostridiaceae bacterium BRH_c20a]